MQRVILNAIGVTIGLLIIAVLIIIGGFVIFVLGVNLFHDAQNPGVYNGPALYVTGGILLVVLLIALVLIALVSFALSRSFSGKMPNAFLTNIPFRSADKREPQLIEAPIPHVDADPPDHK